MRLATGGHWPPSVAYLSRKWGTIKHLGLSPCRKGLYRNFRLTKAACVNFAITAYSPNPFVVVQQSSNISHHGFASLGIIASATHPRQPQPYQQARTENKKCSKNRRN